MCAHPGTAASGATSTWTSVQASCASTAGPVWTVWTDTAVTARLASWDLAARRASTCVSLSRALTEGNASCWTTITSVAVDQASLGRTAASTWTSAPRVRAGTGACVGTEWTDMTVRAPPAGEGGRVACLWRRSSCGADERAREGSGCRRGKSR